MWFYRDFNRINAGKWFKKLKIKIKSGPKIDYGVVPQNYDLHFWERTMLRNQSIVSGDANKLVEESLSSLLISKTNTNFKQ